MKRGRASDPELAELGSFQGSIERSANFRQQAMNHNLGRNVRVVKVLAYVVFMRRAGITLAGPVECRAAIRQNFASVQSPASGPMQAAHFLPGQVRIGARPLWEHATSPLARAQIEFLFGEVEHLPAVFNQADSAAEASGREIGLCAALARACRSLIAATAGAGADQGDPIPMGLLRAAHQEWHEHALVALREAMAGKRAKPGLPPLQGDRFEGYSAESIAARSTASATVWNRDHAGRVLEYYLADQQQRGSAWVSSCRGAIQEVEAHFRS